MVEQTQAPAAEAPKPKRESYTKLWPDAASAIKDATSRDKGPRQAFTAKFGGKEYHIVAANAHHAGGVIFEHCGDVIDRVDTPERGPRTPKTLGLDAIMAAINNLPEAERAAVMASLKTIDKKPAEKAEHGKK